MKAILTCPFRPIASRIASHRAAQGVIYADMLKQTGIDVDVNWSGHIKDHNQYDAMYVYHGNDWTGIMNLFGGVQGFPYTFNTRNFSQFRGKVYSLGIDFPPYHQLIAKKLKSALDKNRPVQPEWLDVDLVNLERMFNTATTIKRINVTDKIVIGDSHAICMYRPGWTVNSTPFKTLNGALTTGLDKFIEEYGPVESFKSFEAYFGNIDIRHHVCRVEGDPIQNARNLANRYLQAVEALPIKDVAIYELLPIEDESRNLPKSGYHKGQPFHGTWEQRNECRLAFRDELENNTTRARIIRWTDYLLNKEGQLSFDHMEKPQSIHLSRGSYPHWTVEEKAASLENFFG